MYARKLIEDPTKAGFLVCERESGGIAGFININNIVEGGFRCGAIGYGAFAHAVGRGLMGEGLGLVLRYAFGPMGLHRLEANIQPRNAASIGLVRGAGFRLEGFSPDFLFIDGAWRDHERWAITGEMPRLTCAAAAPRPDRVPFAEAAHGSPWSGGAHRVPWSSGASAERSCRRPFANDARLPWPRPYDVPY